jgi:hypothetical protein
MRFRIALLLIVILTGTLVMAQTDSLYALTYHQLSGNRIINGQGTFPAVRVLDYELGSNNIALLLDGLLLDEATTFWKMTTIRGHSHTIQVDLAAGTVSQFLPAVPLGFGTVPLAVRRTPGSVDLLRFETGSNLTYPTPIGDDLLYIDPAGAVILARDGQSITRQVLNALLDGRIVVNSSHQAAVYTNADDERYTHGVLGDDYEGTELTVLQVNDTELAIVTAITLPEPDVFEGISPFWADVDQDGVEDLVTTVSNAQVGAQIRVYRVDGSLLASGPVIGQGGRWRHQLAFGPFGPDGELELVDVLTPHIGGVVEYYRLNGAELEIVASEPGYSSHILGSRNLDLAVGGDFNGDGQIELAIPTQDRSAIAGLQRSAAGIEEIWRLPLDGTLASNLSAITLPDNTLALAAGTADSRIRIWLPEG